jgi:predicted nucleic acid-binding protein
MPVKPKVYIETSVVSYLTARPSRDLVRAAHQQVTRDWWETRGSFDLFTSQFVHDEATAGDEGAAASRFDALQVAVLLEITDDAILLAERLVAGGGLPPSARVDALHVAIAAVHGIDFLLTWNCRHLANASLRGRIEDLCRAAGFEPPLICTPLELPRE